MNIPLLRRLQAADGQFVPLAGLGADPVAVRRDLDELEGFGFGLEWHPFGMVAYRGPADRLCPDQIEDGLTPRFIGRRVAVWNRVGSTNDLATQAASSRANAGLVVLAEEQTAGRGRRGRTWTAPVHSSLLMSVLLFPTGATAEPAWLTALAAVAVADVVSEWTGLSARIKWPNDVRVGERKVSGILVERGAEWAVVGVGLNANLRLEDLPVELVNSATSLQILLGAPIDRSELARGLILRLDDLYAEALDRGPERLEERWRERSEHLGRRVAVETADGVVEGRLDAIDLRRGLDVATLDGGRRLVSSARVQAIRALDRDGA